MLRNETEKIAETVRKMNSSRDVLQKMKPTTVPLNTGSSLPDGRERHRIEIDDTHIHTHGQVEADIYAHMHTHIQANTLIRQKLRSPLPLRKAHPCESH